MQRKRRNLHTSIFNVKMNCQDIYDYLDVYFGDLTSSNNAKFDKIMNKISDEDFDIIAELDLNEMLYLFKLCNEKGINVIETYVLLK